LPADIIKTLPTYIKGMGGDISEWWRDETQAALKR
jgi:hypothetical protein